MKNYAHLLTHKKICKLLLGILVCTPLLSPAKTLFYVNNKSSYMLLGDSTNSLVKLSHSILSPNDMIKLSAVNFPMTKHFNNGKRTGQVLITSKQSQGDTCLVNYKFTAKLGFMDSGSIHFSDYAYTSIAQQGTSFLCAIGGKGKRILYITDNIKK